MDLTSDKEHKLFASRVKLITSVWDTLEKFVQLYDLDVREWKVKECFWNDAWISTIDDMKGIDLHEYTAIQATV